MIMTVCEVCIYMEINEDRVSEAMNGWRSIVFFGGCHSSGSQSGPGRTKALESLLKLLGLS